MTKFIAVFSLFISLSSFSSFTKDSSIETLSCFGALVSENDEDGVMIFAFTKEVGIYEDVLFHMDRDFKAAVEMSVAKSYPVTISKGYVINMQPGISGDDYGASITLFKINESRVTTDEDLLDVVSTQVASGQSEVSLFIDGLYIHCERLKKEKISKK